MAEVKSERKRLCLWCRNSKGYRGFESKSKQCRECVKRIDECIMKDQDPRLLDWGVSVNSTGVSVNSTGVEIVIAEKEELKRQMEELTDRMGKMQMGQQSDIQQKERIKELEQKEKGYESLINTLQGKNEELERECDQLQDYISKNCNQGTKSRGSKRSQ